MEWIRALLCSLVHPVLDFGRVILYVCKYLFLACWRPFLWESVYSSSIKIQNAVSVFPPLVQHITNSLYHTVNMPLAVTLGTTIDGWYLASSLPISERITGQSCVSNSQLRGRRHPNN